MEDVLAKVWAQIKWEEDEANFVGKTNNYGNRRNDRVDRRSNDRRSEPYLKSSQVSLKVTKFHDQFLQEDDSER